MTCSIETCELPYKARGYCNRHYMHLWHGGETKMQTRRDDRPIRVEGAVAYVPLSAVSDECAIIDSTDVGLVSAYKWHKNAQGYAMARPTARGKFLRLHRLVMQPTDEQVVDHINHDKLDNRRVNLRACTQAENMLNQTNKTGYKGVSWSKVARKWQARIKYRGVDNYLGLFMDKDEAARAYDKKALELHGEFANLNQLQGVL